jgi:hypothetical protein
MVIYYFRNFKLFLFDWLNAWSLLFDGLIGVMSLGGIKTWVNYQFFYKLVSMEMKLKEKHDKRNSEWPRKMIWPKEKGK